MIRVTADASVAVKWVVPEPAREDDVAQALQLLRQVQGNRVALYQPPHWLAEVAAVATRLTPATADQQVAALHEMSVTTIGTLPVYRTACDLSLALDHHLFDTLYHAVALHVPDAVLLTADERYYRKAWPRGRIMRLADFS